MGSPKKLSVKEMLPLIWWTVSQVLTYSSSGNINEAASKAKNGARLLQLWMRWDNDTKGKWTPAKRPSKWSPRNWTEVGGQSLIAFPPCFFSFTGQDTKFKGLAPDTGYDPGPIIIIWHFSDSITFRLVINMLVNTYLSVCNSLTYVAAPGYLCKCKRPCREGWGENGMNATAESS